MKKTFLKKLVTASIAAVTALSVFRGVPTFADENSDATAMSNGETNAQVSINKVLNIAEGITTPLANFTFTFTPKNGNSNNGVPYETINASNGQIADKTINYSERDVLQPNQTSIKKETGNIFANVTYTHAGEYVYTVAEKQNDGWRAIQRGDDAIDSMTYDNRSYEMHVIVKINQRVVSISHLCTLNKKQQGPQLK